jgi:glycosyltransferase involved in cell wall biosynthesis
MNAQAVGPMRPRAPLNILYTGNLPPHPGGSAISCGELLVGFAERGHRVRCLAPITPEAARAGDPFARRHPRIAVTRFPVAAFQTFYVPPTDEFRSRERAQLGEALPRLIDGERPDIVFIGRETFAWHVPAVAASHSLPCVLRVTGGVTRGILDRTFPDALAGELLEQYRCVSVVASQARHMTERLRALGLRRLETIPNAVDLSRFAPRPRDPALLRQLGIEAGETVVMHVSNLYAPKRSLDVAMSAARALRQTGSLVYVIVGDGPGRQSLEETCGRIGVAERFRFAGWVDYDRMPDYVNLSDLVVMPSEAETQARVYLETQACGRVLVASDIAAAREVIEDGETGVLFRTGDVDDLADKTVATARDAGLRARIGDKARIRVQAHALDRAVDAYLGVFDSAIREHRRGARAPRP